MTAHRYDHDGEHMWWIDGCPEPTADIPDPRPVSPPSELTALTVAALDTFKWRRNACHSMPSIASYAALVDDMLAALDAARAAPQADERDEIIERLKRALRVATHAPHDRDGEPVEGFPTCSGCGAILTGAAPQADDLDRLERFSHRTEVRGKVDAEQPRKAIAELRRAASQPSEDGPAE